MERHALRIQSSLDLEHGPLLRAVLFASGSSDSKFLLIVIHHLAVDTVSWGILLADLQHLYRELSTGETCSLSPKTTSFKHWAERLVQQHSLSGALAEEAKYWFSLAGKKCPSLPVDHRGANTQASAQSVGEALTVQETDVLLHQLPTAYRTQINEVLLTALARVFSRWSGSTSLLLDLEGHGREDILEGVDLSRTVGWFTTIFPVVLDIGNCKTSADSLRLIKEQLRAIPNRGIGYGLLRYAGADESIAARLKELPKAEVRFNYLGQLNRTADQAAAFTVVPGPTGPAQSTRGLRPYLLDLVGTIDNSALRVDWIYSENVHSRETVAQLAHDYVEELRALITQADARNAANLSPTDFPKARVSQTELNKVLSRIK